MARRRKKTDAAGSALIPLSPLGNVSSPLSIYMRNELINSNFVYNQLGMDILCYLILVHESGQTDYRVSASQLEQFFGREFKVHQVDAALKHMAAMTYFINERSKRRLRLGFIHLLEMAIYEDGMFHIRISPAMEPLFCHADRDYTRIIMRETMELTGMYAKRLYMLLREWRNLGSRNIALSELSPLLMPEDVETDHRELVANVRRAVAEINRGTTMHIEAVWQKTGRSYTGVRFDIVQEQIAGEAEQEKARLDLVRYLVMHGLTERQALEAWTRGLTFDQADDLFRLMQQTAVRQSAAGHVVMNLHNYFVGTLRNRGFLRGGREIADVVADAHVAGTPAPESVPSRASVVYLISSSVVAGMSREDVRRAYGSMIDIYSIQDNEIGF